MKFARLLCCLWIVALLGQGFAVSAQSLSLHLPSVTKVKLSQAESPRPKHCPSGALQAPTDADKQLHQQAEVIQHSHESVHQHKAPEQPDSQSNCCSGNECDMNCRHQNGDSPCSANCDLVQISTLVLINELNSHQPIALLSESPRHVRYWLDSPLLARQTPPPKLS